MNQLGESLLKYDDPILIKTTAGSRSPKIRTIKVGFQTAKSKVSPKDEDILHAVLPPREWTEGKQYWIQRVSSTVSTRKDVIHLHKLLEMKLKQRNAKPTGICPIRRELFSQCFDELIRHVTINCAERGLLLSLVRNEIQMTIEAYQTLHESSTAYGVRKAQLAEKGKDETQQKITYLEEANQDLIKQLVELKDKFDVTEKREAERKQQDDTRHIEEIQLLKRTIQQLKEQLADINTTRA